MVRILLPTNYACCTWSGSWIARFAKESVGPNRWSSVGWMPARTGKSSVDVGRKHPVTIIKASSRILSMRRACELRHQTGAVLSCGVDQGKSRDAQCLGTCILSGSRKSSQQRDSGGELFAQSLEVVTESQRPIQL